MPTKVGIIGTGNMANALGRLLVKNNYPIFLGSRTPNKGKDLAKSIGAKASGGSIHEAAEFGEMVILAVHYDVIKETLKAAGDLEGKILIDIINPLSPNFSGLSIGHTTSAAEKIAELVPKAHVVKSFNHAFANTFIAGPLFGSEKATLFYCGDNADAKAKVAKLITDIGFDAVDAGPLKSARYLEPLAMLIVHLGFAQKMGVNIAYKLLRR